MKLNVNLAKLFLLFATLSVVGCSPISVLSNSTAVLPNTPTAILTSFPGKIAFINSSGTGYDYHLYVLNMTDNLIKDITPQNLLLINSLSSSLDGENIAFAASIKGKSQIFTMKTNGTNLNQLTFGEQDAYKPSWSPDGEHIIFLAPPKDTLYYLGYLAQQIYIMKSNGTEIRQLIKDDKTSLSGSYRSDGFISISVPLNREYSKNYIVNSDGVVQSQFPEFVTSMPITWSPDNKLILITDVRPDCSGIIMMNPINSEQNCLIIDKISPPVQVYKASWSPNGEYIVFSSNLDGDYDLYMVKLDGSHLTRLTNMNGNESEPVWSVMP